MKLTAKGDDFGSEVLELPIIAALGPEPVVLRAPGVKTGQQLVRMYTEMIQRAVRSDDEDTEVLSPEDDDVMNRLVLGEHYDMLLTSLSAKAFSLVVQTAMSAWLFGDDAAQRVWEGKALFLDQETQEENPEESPEELVEAEIVEDPLSAPSIPNPDYPNGSTTPPATAPIPQTPTPPL